ncbi:hypothetical protein [Geodermatophilus sp. URMC 62]|uniref:hypothetical protein n=1 Tax=Geodermatophilus sp. URMC 62 TaxID=3423414 RepID=UPI00406CE750
MALVIVTNTGANPARVVTTAGDPDHGRIIAPGATVELTYAGRSTVLRLASDAGTTVDVGLYNIADVRADAAEFYRVPVELIRGRTKAEIAASAASFLRHEGGAA